MARRKTALIVGVVGIAVVAAVAFVTTSDDEGLSLKTIPSGVSARRVDGKNLLLSRNGREVIAFINDAQHMAGEKVWWCPEEQVFAAPTHGETFDSQGRHIGGPASRGLDRLPVEVAADGTVSIDSSRTVPGDQGLPSPRPAGVPDLAAQWPQGFCSSHIGV